MDVYILDENLRRAELIQAFESMIWTERYNTVGDFELVVSPTNAPSQLVEGAYLVINSSDRVMIIDTVERKEDANGSEKLTFKGPSIESVLEDRSNVTFADGTVPASPFDLTGLPAAVVRDLVDLICRTNPNISQDIIPALHAGSITTPGTIEEPSDVVTFSTEIDTLYNTVNKICAMFNIGFRLIRNGETGELYFEVYTGDDRTSAQTIFPAVLFSPEMDNMAGSTELHSTAALKTVAYVFGVNGSAVVYAPGVDPSDAGFVRKVLIVQATDIDLPVGDELTAALTQKGLEELANNRSVIGFDAEIPQVQGAYIYGRDYFLGDLVEQRSDTGMSKYLRVTEQIFVSDDQGDRGYPTLLIDTLVTAGSWFALPSSLYWDDITEYWDDL